MVEEVARNLEGLGFRTQVVCGAEARAALLGRPFETREPMIYVVCVQGTLKETVLKPLRQALATHGGPNQHLFVAVLDLSLPLAMVGQIRRFAEALERTTPGAARRDGLGERRQWRATFGHQRLENLQTHNYRALEVVRPDTAAHTLPRRTITASHRKPRKVAPTQRYTAVTASLPVTAQPARAEPRKSARRRGTTRPKRASRVPADVRTRSVPEPRAETPRVFAASIAPPPRRGRAVVLAAGALGLLGAGAWGTGALDGWLAVTSPDDSGLTEAARPSIETSAAASSPDTQPGGASTRAASEAAEPFPRDSAMGGDLVPASGDGPTSHDDAPPETGAEVSPDEDDDAIEAASDFEATPSGASQEAAILDAAAERRRIRTVGDLWVSPRQKTGTTWRAALETCREFDLDGVSGWRVPFRRELKLIGAVGAIPPGTYWSRSRSDVAGFVWVYEAGARRLIEWLEHESNGAVVCVKSR